MRCKILSTFGLFSIIVKIVIHGLWEMPVTTGAVKSSLVSFKELLRFCLKPEKRFAWSAIGSGMKMCGSKGQFLVSTIRNF